MISNNMRIGGLATGMDIDSIVGDLMKAERIPLDRMQQDTEWLTWQRDAYREMNTKLSEFRNLFLGMKSSSTYQSKSVTSSQEGAISATGTSSANVGTHSIEVKQLATNAMNVSGVSISSDSTNKIDPDATLSSQEALLSGTLATGTMQFTVDRDGGAQTYDIAVNGEDSLNDVLKRITDQDNGVRAFYNESVDKVILERNETGDFNETTDPQIKFDNATGAFFTDTLQLDQANESGGENAQFVYNGSLELESTSNRYSMNGVNYQFTAVTNGSATINVQQNTDASVEKIQAFVDKYNEIIETFSDKTSETRYRDFPPLTDGQKQDMSDREIEQWEEKAMSGTLRNDSILRGALSNMRSAWFSEVNTGNPDYNHLLDIGISTSSDYKENGKLVIDENKLRDALENDSQAVMELFSNSAKDDSRGLLNRVEDSVRSSMNRISDKAGSDLRTEHQYTMGRELLSMAEQMTSFERRLQQVEDRYWSQFTQMEKAIQRMNQQSSYMMQQFGGGQ